MRSSRLKQVEQYIIDNQTVSFDQICDKFNISLNTARRDIKELINTGNVSKVYGGVTAVEKTALVPFQLRDERNHQEKNRIARAAAAMIQNNDIVFVDSGTTTRHIFEHISKELSFTVITHSISVVFGLINQSNIRLIVLPGELERKTNSLYGINTAERLEDYNIQRAFMAATAVSSDGMVTNSSPLEYEIKRTAMRRSYEKVLLIDSAKYGTASLLSYASLQDFDTVITGKKVDASFLSLCEQNQVQAITV